MNDMQTNTTIVKAAQDKIEGLIRHPKMSPMLDVDAVRFALMARKVLSDMPQLAQATTASLRRAFVACALAGLYPDGKQAAILPFKNRKAGTVEATFIPGYLGLIQLGYEHPDVTNIRAGCMYLGERFELREGSSPAFDYWPDMTVLRSSETVMAAWARATVRGEPTWKVISRAEVDAIRARSRAKDDGPWVTDYPQMAAKTAFKQMSKWLPRTRKLAQAIDADDAAEAGIPQTIDAECEEIATEAEQAAGQEVSK
ncbi:MAG: hypothetical protein FJX72_19730 [Armatimonadetes bacterium]|nr:hypothetical protein [Armatimonadota bacterium]